MLKRIVCLNVIAWLSTIAPAPNDVIVQASIKTVPARSVARAFSNVIYKNRASPMSFFELFLTAVGLSMDAFSVSICKGLSMRRVNWRLALILALSFGLFQGGMPVIGYFLGQQFLWLIAPVDHWIAFGLLALIGGNMIREAVTEDDEEEDEEEFTRIDWRELLMLSIATSIDALSIGIAFASLQVNIWFSVVIIAVTTFCFSLAGVVIGNQFGMRYQRPAQITGGVILILIGLKVLVDHLFLG